MTLYAVVDHKLLPVNRSLDFKRQINQLIILIYPPVAEHDFLECRKRPRWDQCDAVPG